MSSSPTPVPAVARTNTLAIVALVLAFVTAVGGVICGAIALRQIRTTGEGGRGLAIAAIVIGVVAIVFYVLMVVLSVAAAGVAATAGS